MTFSVATQDGDKSASGYTWSLVDSQLVRSDVPILFYSQGGEAMETDQMASSVSELQAIIKNIDGEISRLQTLIVTEDDKMLRYKVKQVLPF